MAVTDLAQARQAYIALLEIAASKGVMLNRTKVAKLLYLADLRSVERSGSLFTGFAWRWRHFGPYDNALLTLEESLARDGVLEQVRTENYYGSPEWRIEPRHLPPTEIDRQFFELMSEVVAEYGRLSASSLKDLTYQTEPMADAVEGGANEVLLDFSAVRPAPVIAPVLRHFRDVVAAAGRGKDDPGVGDDLEDEIAALTYLRVRANREMLD